jgi:hypothetical protein
MIAVAGYFRYKQKLFADQRIVPYARQSTK